VENNSSTISPDVTCAPTADATCGSIDGKVETVNELLRLSNLEAQDAIDDLEPKGLHADAVTLLRTAIDQNNQAIATSSSQTRKNLMTSARSNFSSAKAKLGTGLDFTLGAGNLEF
jgi:hypothetical protein